MLAGLNRGEGRGGEGRRRVPIARAYDGDFVLVGVGCESSHGG
jgi:hypothetical protein